MGNSALHLLIKMLLLKNLKKTNKNTIEHSILKKKKKKKNLGRVYPYIPS